MTSIAFPFLRIRSDNVKASSWLLTLDPAQEAVLGERIEKWDYASKLRLTRSISVRFSDAADDLGISSSRLRMSVVTTLGTGGPRAERLKQIVSRVKLSENSETITINVDPACTDISRAIKLSTEIVLDEAPASAKRLSPNLPGMRLWSDSKIVHVDPTSARFSVEAASFRKLFKEDQQGAMFYLNLTAPDWDQHFSNAVRLYINSDEPEFCQRFGAGDEMVLRLVMFAVVNQLVRRALSNESFSLDEMSSPPDSISGVIRNWVRAAFPNQSLATVKSMAEYRPSEFENAVASLTAGREA